ncbi:MAG: formylglycine-generating enzyme family protein [Thermoanaerobaculia bacterium]
MIVPRLVRIDDASFMMGSEERDDERPVHPVFVDAFELGMHQVTNAEYDDFVRATSRAQPPFRDDPNFHQLDQPVVAVSWFDAVSYCEWLSSTTGRRFRLPTEAEWECAARGGVEGELYPWGNAPQSRTHDEKRWTNGPEPVGSGAPNRYGLHDLCENVHEWCSDWYASDYYAVSPERNPRGPDSGSRRVSRGGSWRHHVKVTRCAARSSIAPDLHYADYGFRIACDQT